MLGVADTAVFIGFMSLSVLVGVYHGMKQRRSSSQTDQTTQFLTGNRQLPIVPVCLSLLTTFVSGIALLGVPAEVYHRGLSFLLPSFGGSIAIALCAVFFVPIFYKLQLISVYEYLEIRFESRLLRYIGSLLFIINTVGYMAVVMYAPAIALVRVTEAPLWPFILTVGSVSTIYTTMGGIKAVVWNDALQAAFMYIGLGVLIIKGTIEVGGFSKVISTNYEYGRLTDAVAHFDPTPFQYQSVWILLFGSILDWTCYYGLNQMALQRYCSMPSLRHVRIVMAMTMPAFTLIGMMCCYIGMLMLTYFAGCDPRTSGAVGSKDEMCVLMASRVLAFLPGLQGLFLSSLFSSTLSTTSSGINSVTAVIYEDYLRPSFTLTNPARITRITTFLIGSLTTALAFACQLLGGTFNAATSTLGTTSGPLAGVFILGIFFPKANKYGAFIGLTVTTLFLMTCSVYYNINSPYDDYMYPLPTERSPTCPRRVASDILKSGIWNSSIPEVTEQKHIDLHYGMPGAPLLSRISVFMYAGIGVIGVVVIGAIASALIPYKTTTLRLNECTYIGYKTHSKVDPTHHSSIKPSTPHITTANTQL